MLLEKISIREKVSYALGDASANIAWRGVATFLFIFYTDVFGLTPAGVGLLMMIARFSDGVSDVLMGIVGDHTQTKYGKFRPWILWTAVPLGIILSLLFTNPDWSPGWKVAYAYTTYILFTLIYTANNIPYGALMAVMTGDDKERVKIGSFRMVGAFAGGMIVQGSLLLLVSYFGNINPTVQVEPIKESKYMVVVSAPQDVANVNIHTKENVATFLSMGEWAPNDTLPKELISKSYVQDLVKECDNQATVGKSFSMKANYSYAFVVEGEKDLDASAITIIDQSKGYSKSIYALSVVLVLCLFITFYNTKERISPPAKQESNLKKDLWELVTNKPWLVLLFVGLLFNIFNNIKQGITVIYFTHYIHNQILASSYMVALMLASIGGAMITTPLSNQIGKKNLFIAALVMAGVANSMLCFFGPTEISMIFVFGILSEVFAAILPTLFFTMLGDTADYSEYVNGRRATGLVYSAGSFATKFAGGIAAYIIGMVLSSYGYDAKDLVTVQGAVPGIVMLMSWIPAIFTMLAAALMVIYPLGKEKMAQMTAELQARRASNE
ncbi:MAG: MFS transporter [Paludibacteraceae bacterium]|nr:MFS transporter [Paludibacteraceae bacterium]MBR4839024.1 MFS transporter [Paludibacteraceae bacterium]